MTLISVKVIKKTLNNELDQKVTNKVLKSDPDIAVKVKNKHGDPKNFGNIPWIGNQYGGVSS